MKNKMLKTCLTCLAFSVASAAAEEAYITNFNTGTISKIDITNNTLLKTIQFTGSGYVKSPNFVASTPDGSYAYATQIFAGTVAVIDTATDLQIASIAVGNFPEYITITPNGEYAYVSNRNSNDASVIQVATQSVIATIPVAASPLGIAVTPNGEYAYVVLRQNSVSVIQVATQSVIATISLGTYTGRWGRSREKVITLT